MNILEIDFREEQISRIIDVIVSYRINGSEAYEKNKEFWKELVYYLEEVKINSCNKKYFDMTKIVKIINENKDISESILDYLVETNNKMQNVFGMFFKSYCEKTSLSASYFHDYKVNLDEFYENIRKYPGVHEEIVNFILNGESFDEEISLINVNGYDVLKIQEVTNYPIIMCYVCLFDMLNGKIVKLNKDYIYN